jgi:hypothetical protein
MHANTAPDCCQLSFAYFWFLPKPILASLCTLLRELAKMAQVTTGVELGEGDAVRASVSKYYGEVCEAYGQLDHWLGATAESSSFSSSSLAEPFVCSITAPRRLYRSAVWS